MTLTQRDMRDVYIETLSELAKEDQRILVLDADLMNSNGTAQFLKNFPTRAINVGIQEANMIGIAAGLAATGKIPFTHTFSCFNTRRALDQIYVSVAYAKFPVRIVGTDPGIMAAFNGGTHMSLEDVGVVRGIPTMTVIEPVDNVMLRAILPAVVDLPGPVYLRLNRKQPEPIYEEGTKFSIGHGQVLREGTDVTIVATGIMVSEALQAADLLEQRGVQARVVNIFTIKPIDVELIVRSAQETGAIVTVENHNVLNGLGSAVAEVLGDHYPVPLERVGIQDLFGEVGPVDYLRQRFEMTAAHIAARTEQVLARKVERF